MDKLKVAVFTVDIDFYNSGVIKKILSSDKIKLNLVYFSKPLGGSAGFMKKISRVLSFGVLNVFRIIFQRFKINCNTLLDQSDLREVIVEDYKEAMSRVETESIDLLILLNFNRIIPKGFIERYPQIFNIHPGKLPELRGVMPAFWTLKEGLDKGTVTIHKVEVGIDTGDIFKSYSVPIPIKSYHYLMLDLMKQIEDNIVDDLLALSNENLSLVSQNNIEAKYYGRPTKNDFTEFLKNNRIY